MANFELTFSCRLKDIFEDDNVFIKTKAGRFDDEDFPGHLIAKVIEIEKPSTALLAKKVWTYTLEPQTALPDGVAVLENCDIDGIRLSKECCIIQGFWRGDEIVLVKESGEEIIIPPPDINCSLDDADFNQDVQLPAL